jgi:hypothetical protein
MLPMPVLNHGTKAKEIKNVYFYLGVPEEK